MCSIQGDGWLRGLAPTNLFVFCYVALCLPGAILRGLVACILRRSSISIIVSMLFVFIFYIWYIRLSRMTCRGISVFLMFVADDLPRYLLQRLTCLYSSGVVPAQDLTCVAQSAGT